MKNIFLTLALLLTVSFAFAGNNNNAEETLQASSNILTLYNMVDGTCVYTLKFTFSLGGITYTSYRTYTEEASSYGDCIAKMNAKIASLKGVK